MVFRAALLSCALGVCPAVALAQQSAPFVRDDLSGTLKDQFILKTDERSEGAGARLRFDIDYEYKASLLMGEPVVVCSAKIRDPQGEISFRYDGGFHTVTINDENARLLTPYNVDYAITYKSIHADNAYFLARCNTGIPGSWVHDALNVAASPNWDNFLCWAGGSRFSRPQSMPDSLPDDWCRSFGQGGGKTLDEDEAKKRFAVTAASEGGAITRAIEVDVASFAINYNDLIVAEIKKISAKKIAERKLEQVGQVRNTLHQSRGAAAQAAQQLDAGLTEARSMDDPREQARILQGAMRDVLNIEPTQEGAQAFVELRTYILNLLSSDEERNFIAGIKQNLSELQAATDQSTQVLATIFDRWRTRAANAPQFAFAELEAEPAPQAATGPADITREIKRINAHTGPVYAVAVHPDGKRMISSGQDGFVTIWDLKSGNPEKSFSVSGRVRQVAFSPDGRHAFGANDETPGKVYVWDTTTWQIRAQFTGSSKGFSTLAVDPHSRFLLTAQARGRTTLWNLETLESAENYVEKNEGLGLATFSQNGRYAIYQDYIDYVWRDIETGTIEGRAKRDFGEGYHKFIPAPTTGVLPFGDHSRLPLSEATVFTVEYRHQLTVFHPNGWKEAITLASHMESSVVDFSISPDGKFALAGYLDGLVGITRLEDKGTVVRTVGRHDEQQAPELVSPHCIERKCDLSAVYSVAFSPDGALAISGGSDGSIRIWGP